MRMHMKKVAIQHQLPLIVREGFVVNDSEIQQPGTFTITSLREPVSRALSSYQFEGAWPQMANSSFRAANPPLSLREWAMRREASRPLKSQSFLWQCAGNCYCKWFGLRELGTHEESRIWNQSLSDKCAHARATLEHFDLVVPSERLSDPTFMGDLSFTLNTSLSPSLLRPTRTSRTSALVINESDVALLKELNQLDTRLFDWATRHLGFAKNRTRQKCFC